MKKAILALVVSALFVPAGLSARTPDVAAPIRQFIDGFNTGDPSPPLLPIPAVTSPSSMNSPPTAGLVPTPLMDGLTIFRRWQMRTGSTDGNVHMANPRRTEIKGDTAYVIIPTVYTYKLKGQPMVEEGQMTFALRSEGGAWKIGAWTWSGVKPHPPKPKEPAQ